MTQEVEGGKRERERERELLFYSQLLFYGCVLVFFSKKAMK